MSSDRVVVKESLTLKDRQINTINKDNQLSKASNSTLSTGGAIRNFIDNLVGLIPVGSNQQRDSILSRNPITGVLELSPALLLKDISMELLAKRQMLELNITSYSEMPVSEFVDSLDVTIISSDGVITKTRCGGNALTRVYGYGSPPFNISFFCINTRPDRIYMLEGRNYFNFYQICYYGDTLHYTANKLCEQVYISFENLPKFGTALRDSVAKEVTIVNNTKSYWLYLDSYEDITVAPGDSTTIFFRYLPYARLNFNAYVWYPYEGYLLEEYSLEYMHYRLYKNDVLFEEMDVPKPIGTVIQYPTDSTWRRFKLVLDNI
ncbi:hypothetical protein [Chitinophaga dinghuensis]|uniref:hypothetical protein n=1 Tax=Chitinophaga dinghuensis TaxID=1539050 RepID=UPI0011B93A07|nr:hypothetical protein [Chitinophaga dinghuensis]